MSLVFPGPICALSRAEETGEDIPLGKQLEGLAPEPRIAYLRYLLRTSGEDPEVYFQLGVAFHDSSELDSALQYYGKATALNHGLSKAYVNMGVVYDEQGRTREALHMFEAATRLGEDDLLASAHAAFIRFELGDYELAWKHLSRALEIDPNHPQSLFYLAIFFWESGMYREALAEWERVIELDRGGYLAERARENIILLQKAMNAPSGSRGIEPVK